MAEQPSTWTGITAGDSSQVHNGHHYGDTTNNYNNTGDIINHFSGSATERTERPPKPCSTVPFLRNRDFVARPALVDDIQARLSTPRAWLAIVGLGGVGKTQLAVEYAEHLRKQSPETWVLWLHAATVARFEQSVREVAGRIKVPGRGEPNADILQLFQEWFQDENNGKWLVVLDNVDDAAVLLDRPASGQRKRLLDYLPPCDHGTVLITTRSEAEALKVVFESQILHVGPMSIDDAEDLLRKMLGEEEQSLHKHLAELLDCLPLALTQASAYINKRRPRCSVKDYIAVLENSRETRASLVRHDGRSSDRDLKASSTTWQISFEYVRQTRPTAADLLAVMSFCDRQSIPESLVRDEKVCDADFEADVIMLRGYSFISTTVESTSWEMHRLVQDATQMWLGQLKQPTDAKKPKKLFKRLFQNRPQPERPPPTETFYIRFLHNLDWSYPAYSRYEDWSVCQILYPHALSIASRRPTSREALLAWASIMFSVSWHAKDIGQYKHALAMAQGSVDVYVPILGEEDARTLDSMGLLGEVLRSSGRLEEAETMQVKVLETRRKLRYDDLSLHHDMDGLASTYRDQGRYAEAEKLQLQIYEARKKEFGPPDPTTLAYGTNLAAAYLQQEKFEEAEKLLVEISEAQSTILGSEHPDTLTSLDNLAYAYSELGRLEEAEKLLQRVLEARTKMLGPDHIDTLWNMLLIAKVHRKRGHLQEAEQLGTKVIDRLTINFGAKNRLTLTCKYHLALTYEKQGRFQESEELLVSVVEGRTNQLGAQHPDTLHAVAWLDDVRKERIRSTQQAEETDPS
jgi:tetratricopeptide (TPR) repeat protein